MGGKKALIVYNPASGAAVDPELWLGTIVHRLCEQGQYLVTVFATEPGSTSDHLFERVGKEFDIAVAAGGDGTMRFVFEAVAKSGLDIPIGLIPLGTGNLLARNLQILEENILMDPLDEAMKVVLEGKPLAMDLGIMNGHYFAVAAGAGPMSDAIIMPEQKDKANWKMLAYASSVVQTFAQPPVVFKVNADEDSFKVAASGIFVTNLADLGLGKLSDTAELNDGLLDLVILAPKEFKDYIDMGFKFAGAFVGGEAPYYIKKVKYVSIEVLPLRSRISQIQQGWNRLKSMVTKQLPDKPDRHREVTAMIDGDPVGTTPMQIEVAPRVVKVLAPKTLLSSLGNGGSSQ